MSSPLGLEYLKSSIETPSVFLNEKPQKSHDKNKFIPFLQSSSPLSSSNFFSSKQIQKCSEEETKTGYKAIKHNRSFKDLFSQHRPVDNASFRESTDKMPLSRLYRHSFSEPSLSKPFDVVSTEKAQLSEKKEEIKYLREISFQNLGIPHPKEILTTPPQMSKGSFDGEPHLKIAYEFLQKFTLDLDTFSSLQNKLNRKKMAQFSPLGKSTSPLKLSDYSENLNQLGEVFKRGTANFLLKDEGSKNPYSTSAKKFMEEIKKSKGLKKIELMQKRKIINQCCEEFGDCIIEYAASLKRYEAKEEMRISNKLSLKIHEATKSLVEYFHQNANIRQEGIFRQSGEKNRIDSLIAALKESSSFDIGSLQPNTNVMADALKSLFGEMELFATSELEELFIQLGKDFQSESSEQIIIGQLKGLVRKLSIEQQQDLKAIMEILNKIGAKENVEFNKMPPQNLAIVFGPRLCNPKDPLKAMDANQYVRVVAESMIFYQSDIFSQNN